MQPRHRRIRVCHVQLLPMMSGVQRVSLEIFKHLDLRRYEPHVVCRAEGPLTEELARLGIAFHVVPEMIRSIRPHHDWPAYRRLRALFEREAFDVVHTHSSKPGVLGRIAARHAGVPAIVHHVHGYAFHEFSSPLGYWVGSQIERQIGRYCDRVIFVNQEERELSIRRGWLPAEKCVTVCTGVDCQALADSRQSVGRAVFRRERRLRDDEVAILVSGRIDNQKQPLIIPEIAKTLNTLLPRAAWRIFVSGTGPLENDLIEAIHRCGVERRVELLGWQDDRLAMVRGCDVVLQPSLWEGLPASLIEAQAAGQAAVASDVKGNRELVTPDNGFLCSPKDASAYAAALAQLIADPALRETLGDAGRQQSQRHFQVSNYRRVAELYDEMLGVTPQEETLRFAA